VHDHSLTKIVSRPDVPRKRFDVRKIVKEIINLNEVDCDNKSVGYI